MLKTENEQNTSGYDLCWQTRVESDGDSRRREVKSGTDNPYSVCIQPVKSILKAIVRGQRERERESGNKNLTIKSVV